MSCPFFGLFSSDNNRLHALAFNFPVNFCFSLLSVYASNFLCFFISDNHSLVLDTTVCVSLLSVCPSVQWFLYHLFRTTEFVLGSPAFDGNSRVLACGSSQLCVGCFAQVNIFEILGF